MDQDELYQHLSRLVHESGGLMDEDDWRALFAEVLANSFAVYDDPDYE